MRVFCQEFIFQDHTIPVEQQPFAQGFVLSDSVHGPELDYQSGQYEQNLRFL
jgi:hypothetical protein